MELKIFTGLHARRRAHLCEEGHGRSGWFVRCWGLLQAAFSNRRMREDKANLAENGDRCDQCRMLQGKSDRGAEEEKKQSRLQKHKKDIKAELNAKPKHQVIS